MYLTMDKTKCQRFVGGSMVLKKPSAILVKVKSRGQKPQKYKFGVQVPNDVAEANKIDNYNENTFRKDAINKDIENYLVAFQLLGREDKSTVGYKEITCHLIFDVKMDLTRKL